MITQISRELVGRELGEICLILTFQIKNKKIIGLVPLSPESISPNFKCIFRQGGWDELPYTMPVSTGWVGVNCGRKTVSTFGTNCSQFCFFVPISITFELFDVEISKFSALRAMQPIVFTRCKKKIHKNCREKGKIRDFYILSSARW